MNRLFSLLFIAAAAVLSPIAAKATSPLDMLGNIFNTVTSTDKFEVSSLAGTWSYQSPAVTFKSDNALSTAGGVAASATIESKLSPYYKRLGLNTMQFAFDAEGNFTLTVKKVTLKGTVTKNGDDGSLTFNFQSSRAINLGHVSAKASKSATGVLTLTFDASRVISIVKGVASFTKNSSLQTISTLLDSYNGIYAGAKFKKSK